MKITEIISAWVESFNPSKKSKELAERRVLICEECPSLKKIFDKEWAAYCGECGCPIQKKIYTNSENPCPLGKWSETDKGYFETKKENTLI